MPIGIAAYEYSAKSRVPYELQSLLTASKDRVRMHKLATSYAILKNKAKQEILPKIIYRIDFMACSPLPTADAKCQVDIAKTPMCRSPRL